MSNTRPMREVERALLPLRDASSAIARGLDAWNLSQLSDAIRSARFFLDKAESALIGKDVVAERAPAIEGLEVAIEAQRAGLIACANAIGPNATARVAAAHDKVLGARYSGLRMQSPPDDPA